MAKHEAFLSKIESHIKENPRKGAGKSGKKRTTGKAPGEKAGKSAKAKGATYQETYGMVKDGLSIEQIAVKRSLTEGTIESHIARGIGEGKVNISKFMTEDDRKTIAMALLDKENEGLNDVFASFKGKYSYGKIRMVQAAIAEEN